MDIKKVLIVEKTEESVIQTLKNNGISVDYCLNIGLQKILEIIEKYDALIVRSATKVTKEVIEAGKNLKLIARAGVGIDNVDVKAATENSILVINAPNGNTASKLLKDGVWNRKDFVGFEVCNKTLGIIGLGRIGKEVGIRMKAFNMKIICYDPVIPAEVATSLGFEFVSLDDIWQRSDYISVHVPLLPATKHLINKTTLAKCKTGVMIVNCARGGIVNEADLLEAILSRKVYSVGLDVFEEEPPKNEDLLSNQFVSCTPHLGASTLEAQIRVGTEIVEQIFALNRGEKISGAVNGKDINIGFLR